MSSDNDIAIVGIAVRLPGALNHHEYWNNLRNGIESVRVYADDELLAAGVKKDALLRPNYVKAGAPLDRMDHFDAEFFGFSPKEAAIMDPQHRQFLEACWEALEDAGHVPERFEGPIGVFAGSGMAAYFAQNILTNPELVRSVGMFLLRHTGNDKDFLSTRASYLLDLRGPAINVQTACSTSLVAAHLAVQHLLSGECDMALAGGVTIELPHRRGYHYEDGEILSPDGHCRAFDHRAEGTVFGSGTGVVVLRRLQDALDDGDQVYAVIKGTAVNNDGSQKVGYLAPSVDGQAACIAEALAVADVDADSVTYVECHGTGTAMGDPIEVAALTQAFREGTDKVGFCGLGSVKTNIGHLDTAAGVASLVKASLALQHAEIPPTLNYEAPNPRIEFEDSPFFVNDALREWKPEVGVRRAGVNSLGVGGTNAFAILEEPPARTSVPSTKPWQLLVLSARNRAALDDNQARLAAHLKSHPELDLGDVAFTLLEGRRHFAERRVLVAGDRDEAIALLEGADPRRVYSHTAGSEAQKLAFMFPGGGAQYPRMAADLYATEPTFRADVDKGLQLLQSKHGIDLKPLLFCEQDQLATASVELEKPSLQLPAIFIVEYALAQLLIARGLQPTALIGHSVGENTAACVAGTMRFEDCLGLIVLRGQLMDRTAGGMLAVPLGADELQPMLDEFGLDLAVVNAPDLAVASGDDATLGRLEARLREMGVEAQRVKINIAAHSRMLDPVLDEFGAYLRSITLSKPKIPWVSNRTGTWVTDAQATDPQYWVDHLRGTVRFADGIATLAAEPGRVFLEVGPGKTLSSLARMSPAVTAAHSSIPVLRHAEEAVADDAFLLGVTGRLWAAGGALESAKVFEGEQRRRVSLPTYAFQGQRYFIEPGSRTETEAERGDDLVDKEPYTDRWFYEPVWRRRDVEDPLDDRFTHLVFADAVGVADQLVPRLRAAGHRVVVVRTGDSYACVSPDEYRLAPEQGRDGYDQLLRDLTQHDRIPDRVLHLALLAHDESHRDGSSFFHRNQELGFYSLLFLAQAWAADGVKRPLHVMVATAGMQRVSDDDAARWPDQATVLGPALVMPRELGDVSVSVIDVAPDEVAAAVGVHRGSPVKRIARTAASKAASASLRLSLGGVVDALEVESRAVASNDVVAVRDGQRWVADVRRAKVPAAGQLPLRQGAAVLVTGGLGGISLTVAGRLAERRGVKLVLLSRSGLPPRDQWGDLVAKLGSGHAVSQRIAAVRSLEARGAEVEVMAGDVTDVVRMREITAEMRRRWGGVHGVVHAAGVVNDGLMLTKRQADVEDVLSPKVAGTLVLEEVTADDDLDLFVVFSSTSTVTAPMGQVDYVAANAFLNAFARSRHGARRTKVLALDWGIWNEVGMAAEAAHRMVSGGSDETIPCAHPWFTQRTVGDRGVHELFSTWSPDTDWLLDDHRTAKGDALVPGAGYLEIARAALAEIGVDRAFELRELVFFRPLAIRDGSSREVRTRLTPIEHGYALDLFERVVVDGPHTEGAAGTRSGWRRTGSATILLLGLPEMRTIDVAEIEARCATRGPRHSKQEEHLRFGPRWQVVSQSRFGDGEAIACLHLPDEFHGDLGAIGIHPALVDLGTGFAMDLIDGYTGDRLWVPIDYEVIGVHGHLPADLVAHVRVHRGSTEASGFARFDVTLADTDGRVLVEVREFSIKRLDGELDLEPGSATSDVEFDQAGGSSDRHLSKSELVFQHTLRQGILPDEGADAFERVVSGYAGAQVIVSSVDLAALVGQTDAAAAAQANPAGGEDGASFARPDLDSEYVAPRDGIEEALVEMWQELLGVSQVGVLDSFFDLGGHSLIAVRLFSKVRKQFQVDFPISVLFEAPTVEAVAALIRSAVGGSAATDGDAPAAVVDRPRFKYLVPMHTGGGGANLPFFLVAGMFGNVLNLRHLANQIGGDRPFYGVQARGVYGGDEPHETFEEMARDYLAEIRQVQPHGPYLFGGFSGGGIAALEMARQLREVGEETILLVMLDTPLPQGPELTKQDKVQMHLQNLKRDGVRYPFDWVKGRLMWREVARRRKLGIVDESEEGSLHSSEIEAAFYRAIARYEVRHHPGTITLFRPKLNPTHVFGPDRMINRDKRFIYADNGWTPHSDRVEVFEMPGDHDSMVLEPNVRVLAAKMREQILAAEHAALSLSGRSPR